MRSYQAADLAGCLRIFRDSRFKTIALQSEGYGNGLDK